MRSFLLTETDERDATYFILYQLQIIQRAIDELQKYLRRKVREVRKVENLVRDAASFNHRQLALLSDAARNPLHHYTYQSHAASHAITHETARNDLQELFKSGLLTRERVSRRHVFRPASDLQERLHGLTTQQAS